jgi:hypothetical protein
MQVVSERLIMAVSGVSHVQERRNLYVTLQMAGGAQTLHNSTTL